MTLVDTSVWIDHFRHGNEHLSELLRSGGVLVHPVVIGELCLGVLRNRAEIMHLLGALSQLSVAEHDEVLGLVRNKRLAGKGIGWVDAHLPASTLLAGARIPTAHKLPLKAGRALGIAEI